jgi:hypothetical protein
MICINNGKIWVSDVGEILRYLETALDELSKNGGMAENKNRGYFSIRRRGDGRILLLAQIGECPSDKEDKYKTLCLEKGWRLFRKKRHLSSWQSRNEKANKYAGAICAGPLIFSFSGLSELVDEAAMLLIAFDLGVISLRTYRRIAKISANPLLNLR